MCEVAIIYSYLQEIRQSIEIVLNQTERVKSPEDFTGSQDGVFMLGGVCMQLIFIGEKVKNLDKKTGGTFLTDYPEIPWHAIMGLRNMLAHEYHSVDEEEIFSVIKNDLPVLLDTILKMELNI